MQLLSLLISWVYPRNNTTSLVCGLEFAEGSVTEVIDGSRITERDLGHRLRYFRVPKVSFIHFVDKIIHGLSDTLGIIKLRVENNNKSNSNCLNLLVLPPNFHN